MITLKASVPLFYTNGALGISITNETTGDTFTITSVDGSGTDTITYSGFWGVAEPVYGEASRWAASGTDYENADGDPMPDHSIALTNCTPEIIFILTFDGSISASLSVPLTYAGAGSAEFVFSTAGGVLQDLINGYQITTGDVFLTPAEVTDILVDGVSVGLGGAAPVDGLQHTVKFIFTSMSEKTAIGTNFVGSILSAKLTHDAAAADNIYWKLDSGPTLYNLGTEELLNGGFDTTDNWNLIENPPNSTVAIEDSLLKMVGDGASARATQVMALGINTNYEVNINVARGGAGNSGVDIRLGDAGYGQGVSYGLFSTTGLHKFHLKASNVYTIINRNGTTTDIDIDSVSVKEVLSIPSDGLIYQDSETHGTESDIMIPDSWTTKTGFTTAGRTVTTDGTQADNTTVDVVGVTPQAGIHMCRFIVYATVGEFKLIIGNATTEYLGNGTYTLPFDCDGVSPIRVLTSLGGVVGSCEVISVLPVLQALLYNNVEAENWEQA